MELVIIFHSIHDVMKAESELKGKGKAIDLIPVPKEISSDCGMAIICDYDDIQGILSSLKGIPNLSIKGIYLKEGSEYREWKR